MDVLVMAGGKGERMGGIEKPMLLLCGKPLISYVLEALSKSSSIGKIYVAVSPSVPQTSDYIKKWPDKRVSIVMTPGSGYIEDMDFAVRALGHREPLLVVSADLPLITPAIIERVISEYHRCGKEALSVRVEAHGASSRQYLQTNTGALTIPAGLNVVHGAHIDRAQDEYVLILEDPSLAANVNYRKDLTYCEQIFAGKHGEDERRHLRE
ncbi:NTP transferase domain-containing protein [Methanocella conradii]|uniref:NTP transferase domain-containing protein n=1 Tax=Methanocella conradii TaxID=1175444 RepID=UPI0024B338CC|nr:NTP transferase domain-containing protein [Methanocella conradii]MDI6896432.1 NTP transferase domain-containing protein [Methanocella conradii]